MNLAELLVTTPTGASLLAALEREAYEGRADDRSERYIVPDRVDLDAVARAVRDVRHRSPAWILSRAVKATVDVGGSWWNDAPAQLAAALRSAPDVLDLAVAVVDRLGPLLSEPLDLARQQCWLYKVNSPDFDFIEMLGSTHSPYPSWVTASYDGLWTVTDPAAELCGPMLAAWEYDFKPITRWGLTVDPAARVLEINGPEDWQGLVERYPLARSDRPNSSWELPRSNQSRCDYRSLAAVPNQRAQRSTMRYFVEPEWSAVAKDFDAVHLTWAGFLTCEGTAIDLADGDVAMLRNWNSERTLWLNPVLSEPEPLPALPLPADDTDYDDWIVDARNDPDRLETALAWFSRILGPPPG